MTECFSDFGFEDLNPQNLIISSTVAFILSAIVYNSNVSIQKCNIA